MGSLPAAGYWSNAARNEGEQKQTIEDVLKGIKQLPDAGVAVQALTLSADQITPSDGASGDITIDTEASAATDNLAQIVQTNLPDGSVVRVRNTNAARVVVVKHAAGGSGQLSLKSGGDFVLADPDRHWLILKRSGTTWKEIARFPSADLAPILSKSANYTTTAADRGQFIDCTATLTLTLLAAATAGKGFELCVQCSGGVTTIDPNLSETIGGAATLVLQRGDKVWIVCDGTNWQIVQRFSAQGGLPVHGHLWGLTLSNNGVDAVNDLDIAAGEAMSNDADSADAVLMRLTSSITKQLDVVWAIGTNAGMLDTGVVGNGTYHIFVISRPDTGVVDVLASLSPSAPTMPTNYTKKRRIGSILRESAAIVGFVQDGDQFQRKTTVQDVNAVNPGTLAVTRTLSVPTGVNMVALFNAVVQNGGTLNVHAYFSDLAVTDEAPPIDGGAAPGLSLFGVATGKFLGASRNAIRTNTSAQIRSRLSESNGNTVLILNTLGWIDTRGRTN